MLKTFAEAVTRTAANQFDTLKEHSPGILLVVGGLGVVTSTVLACRATLKMHEVLDEGKDIVENIENIDEVKDADAETVDNAKKAAKTATRLQVAIRVAKLYAPAVVIGVASLAMITGSHVVLKNRNTGLVAAYTTLDTMYKRYRSNVVADQGEQKDKEYRFGVVSKEVVDPETGLVETAHGMDGNVMKAFGDDKYSDYARMFDKANSRWEPDRKQNHFYLRSVIGHFEDRLRTKGRVFLNEVYVYMGYEPTEAGQMVGWRRDADKDGTGDGFISFGLEHDTENALGFVNGTRHDFMIDFNVDGVITKGMRKV